MRVKMRNGVDFHWDMKISGLFMQKKIDAVTQRDDTRLEVHNLFAKTINPWVPMDEGVLSQTLEITPRHIRYNVPYAHYMYVGEVYGPNIPIKQDGIIVGWFSPPGKRKYPTGRQIQYSVERHPLATKEWDKVAMQSEMPAFKKQVKAIIKRRIKQLYG